MDGIFLDYLNARLSYHKRYAGVTHREVARCLRLSPAALSKRLNNKLVHADSFTIDNIKALDDYLLEGGALVKQFELGAARMFSVDDDPAGLALSFEKSRHAELTQQQRIQQAAQKPPGLWQYQLENLFRYEGMEYPVHSRIAARQWANDLRYVVQTTRDRQLRLALQPFAGLASLADAWCGINHLPTARLGEVIKLASVAAETFPLPVVRVMGAAISAMAQRMQAGSPEGIDYLETFKSEADRLEYPFVSGAFYEELAKEKVMADSYGFEDVMQAILSGKQHFARDPSLSETLLEFDDIEARAYWSKLKDPKVAEQKMQGVIRGVMGSYHQHRNLLALTRGYVAMFKAESEDIGAAAEYRGAYRIATQVGITYFEERLRTGAGRYGIDITKNLDA